MTSFYDAIAKQLKQSQDELSAAEEVTNIVFPTIDGLNKAQIMNPVSLKVQLAKLDKEYRDAVYGVFRAAVDGGPEGSFIVLDPEKVLSILDEIDLEDGDLKIKKNKKKKFIIGITKKVASRIKGLVISKLSAVCHLVNDVVLRKIINTPSDGIRTGEVQVKPLREKVVGNVRS